MQGFLDSGSQLPGPVEHHLKCGDHADRKTEVLSLGDGRPLEIVDWRALGLQWLLSHRADRALAHWLSPRHAGEGIPRGDLTHYTPFLALVPLDHLNPSWAVALWVCYLCNYLKEEPVVTAGKGFTPMRKLVHLLDSELSEGRLFWFVRIFFLHYYPFLFLKSIIQS